MYDCMKGCSMSLWTLSWDSPSAVMLPSQDLAAVFFTPSFCPSNIQRLGHFGPGLRKDRIGVLPMKGFGVVILR